VLRVSLVIGAQLQLTMSQDVVHVLVSFSEGGEKAKNNSINR
jgi:hypothetical protein